MREAQKEYGWKFDFGSIAQIWRGGCIIRAAFLQKITEAYARNPALANLLLDPYFNKTVRKAQANWRYVVALAAGAACRRRRSARPSLTTTVIAGPGCRPTSSRPSATTSGPTPMSGSTSREGRNFHFDWPEPTLAVDSGLEPARPEACYIRKKPVGEDRLAIAGS